MLAAPLQFLIFDESDDASGLRTWDAMASPAARHTAALVQEVQQLLDTLTDCLGPSGPVDEGHVWDLDLRVRDATGRQMSMDDLTDVHSSISLAISLSGGDALAELLSGPEMSP